MATTVFSGVASDTDVRGSLFQGIKFWISHKVPQRSRFLNDVKVNGGEALPLEKNADVKIVDHARKEAPPGSHSYTFIEKSIRSGVLEDLEDHRVGPPEGNIRSIGSVVQPAKGTRNKYTEADDRILWKWVNENPQKGGGTDGNEIYKQLERRHPQHPWQSWRDRWIRHLKGTVAPFSLPHNAPPTPPLDVPSTTESSKNQANTSDTIEDDYLSFSDDAAEALMAVGDDILNIHPDNITEAWESWTRDHDKDDVHTAQQWQSYWEESVRPRYLRRKAKQTRQASPTVTVPAKSQATPSPKRTIAAPLPAFSPLKQHQSLVPELSQKMVYSKTLKPISPNRSTAAAPPTASPDLKSKSSLSLDSPEKIRASGGQNRVSPKISVIIYPSDSSAFRKKDHPRKPSARSPYNHPDSPTMTATAPSKIKRSTDIFSTHGPSLPSSNVGHTPRTPEKPRSPYHETLKRKHVSIEEDLPSSSPIGPKSPKRRRPAESELPVEIASTPEKGRGPDNDESSSSPLFINLELEEDEPNLPAQSSEIGSPLGQKLSDTLSEPGHTVRNNTQAIFESATPPLDFDVPEPEGGWDNEELLVQNSSQPLSLDLAPTEYSREEKNRSIRESAQWVDFDLGGWDDQAPKVKEEPGSPNTETHDPEPTLPDTQAILRSKTPAPDFSIPDPDGGWDSLMGSSPPAMPSSPRAESVFSPSELTDQMDAWIDAHAVKRISVEQVESVLKSTSMDTTLAGEALRHLAEKGSLPGNRRGLWTGSDDEDLRSTDARTIQRLHEKHGADCLTARWEFLAFYDAEEEEEEEEA